MLDDYEVVAARAFAEPYADELRALVRVCGDHFEQHGDPRGTLIALGEARYDATGARAHELQDAIDAHVLAHHAGEVDGLAELMRYRKLALEWRAGRVYGALLDARRGVISVWAAVNALLRAPAARRARPVIAAIPGRAHRYDPETRSAAGAVLAALDSMLLS